MKKRNIETYQSVRQYIDSYYMNSKIPSDIEKFEKILNLQIKLKKEINKFFQRTFCQAGKLRIPNGCITELEIFTDDKESQ